MRKLLFAVLLVLLLAFAVASPVLFPRPCPVTQAAFDRIEIGMTIAEAEDVMGVPPGDYTTRPGFVLTPPFSMNEIRGGCHHWEGDEGSCFLLMDGARVSEKVFCPNHAEPLSPLGLLVWRVERWHENAFGPGR